MPLVSLSFSLSPRGSPRLFQCDHPQIASSWWNQHNNPHGVGTIRRLTWMARPFTASSNEADHTEQVKTAPRCSMARLPSTRPGRDHQSWFTKRGLECVAVGCVSGVVTVGASISWRSLAADRASSQGPRQAMAYLPKTKEDGTCNSQGPGTGDLNNCQSVTTRTGEQSTAQVWGWESLPGAVINGTSPLLLTNSTGWDEGALMVLLMGLESIYSSAQTSQCIVRTVQYYNPYCNAQCLDWYWAIFCTSPWHGQILSYLPMLARLTAHYLGPPLAPDRSGHHQRK
ncbi:hypothetical protein VFPPC_18133 [Pochonia chlamydosporia 170]|uniref:Uncharacterized protein n=1 Tax=Pochonia chlamydosporia 170 TaxID=1380566 RepID=A0A219APF9_METCM|nr:hypothetical protein VFPPC_18133 [Pochonia chlamydosporia 170]OWT42720.1 hypothetical protein VFPPC_18133 [Pochonia chlamydosporia 170]